jgi:flavin-dependent dehydrogenase
VSGERDVEVAVVGGGPAGAAVAAQLCRQGHEVALFERLTRPTWRACGVYSSPLTRRRLSNLGLTNDQLGALIRPISAMVVETADGTAACRLEYPRPNAACGLDRVRLEEALLELIRDQGVHVFEGAVVRSVDFTHGRPRLVVSQADGVSTWSARVVVGADGPTSVVARSAGVTRHTRWFRRAALTGHRAVAQPEARMIVGRGWYAGLAPVPGDRVNVGLVMGESRLRSMLTHQRPNEIVNTMLEPIPSAAAVATASPTDEVTTHLPLLHRVTRVAGDGFVLVGDACGFIDPLSGEGLHRALVSAELAATAVDRLIAGDRAAGEEYDRRLRDRFRGKDILSWALQLFTQQPVLARRAIRRLDANSDLRQTFGAALADLRPASVVIDPRFVARLLA